MNIQVFETQMSGNTVFAIISVAVMITVGIVTAVAQCGLMIFVLGRWGPAWIEKATGQHVVYFLSDIFVLSPGLAYAWTISIIPSVAIAATIIRTSLSRDAVCVNQTPKRLSKFGLRSIWNRVMDPTLLVLFLVFMAYMGLMLLSLFDLHHPSNNHYVGVGLFAFSGVFLNFWVVYLDYTVERNTWHPVLVFDCSLVLLSIVALCMFIFGSLMVSACSEWSVLLLMVVLHTLLPIRGARVVLSRPRGWHNVFRKGPGRGQIVLVDPRPANKIDF
jgi:hypothetical protein